jgi:hypothetical protein
MITELPPACKLNVVPAMVRPGEPAMRVWELPRR